MSLWLVVLTNVRAQLITNVIYDLCSHPSYIDSIRDEWQHVITSTGANITERTLGKLHKMDSFIRESQRLTPFSLLTMTRYIGADVTLSNGQVLPRGHTAGVALDAMNHDPNLFENPHDFDGERFVKLRAKRDDEEIAPDEKPSPRWGLLDIHAEANVNFGFGKHACPGRLLAVNEVGGFLVPKTIDS